MVMGVCASSEVNNWTVFDSLDLTSQEEEQQEEEEEKGLLGRTDRGPTKTCRLFSTASGALVVGGVRRRWIQSPEIALSVQWSRTNQSVAVCGSL